MKFSPSNSYASAVFICALLSPVLSAQALVPDEATTITLDQAVHFIGTDGSDAVADPGDYSVEAAQEWLRLIPGTERRDALLIEAQPGTHEVKVEIPIVISTPGTEPDELDLHIVQLLNPDGTSMVAYGTYSGIQSRGFRDRARGARQAAARRARARAEGARRAAAAKAQQTANAARIAALRAKQAAEAHFVKPEEARLEKSRWVPPTQFRLGSNNTFIFKDASGWRRKVCPWVGGHLVEHYEWGCQSRIDLANGRIQIKADHHGSGVRMGLSSKAWVEIYKDFKITRPPGYSGNLNGFMTILVPIKAIGKAKSTSPLAKASYNISLALSSTDRGYAPRPPQVVASGGVRAKVKKVWIIPVPIPQSKKPDRSNQLYFRERLYPDRIYTLTLRVDVKAGGIPVQGHMVGSLDGSYVNFMDKKIASIEPSQEGIVLPKEIGVIEWGDVTVIVE
ncbi:MAG: hypothetical protein O7B35_08625 [Deltaproteobacteria bacterium]|nr:hypothetical protein [Deltaproteobacteria bacterium]